jgi:hypothetical protein
MARNHGRILASVWVDPDWVALPPRQQWLYMLLLSQPRLSLVGTIDYRPAKWARLAEGVDTATVEAAAAGLEAARYVLIDRDTEELLVRTFVRHDGVGRGNANLRKGMWAHWMDVASEALREAVIVNMPAELWDDHAPDAAYRLRRSLQSEPPFERPSEPPFRPSMEQAPEPSLPPEDLSPTAMSRPDHRLDEETIERGFAGITAALSALETRGQESN